VRVDFVSLFPESLTPFLESSMLGRASRAGLVEFGTTNPRDFCTDKHLKVDDTPFGGHPGMLIKVEPVWLAVESLAPGPNAAIILPSPAAKTFVQADAAELASLDHLIFLCGHYEGFDHRIETELATHLFSLGDFVLTNGEMPAVCMADAVIRLLPGVLGDPQSLQEDSFSDGLLSAPNYTRPEIWRNMRVPEVLLSGNHAAIKKWRRAESLRLTRSLRPDLFGKVELSKQDLKLIADMDREGLA
jgi:tRNA (guanine37-N1)-methyltransferase